MQGKRVIVAVTGGIAAYKAVELVRLLMKSGADTRVAMTANATRFVAPMTFEAVSGHKVIWDMWSQDCTAIDHVSWGQEADLIILAPATANVVAKMAHGIADDFLSTMVLAATAEILVCPSMNTQMYQNSVTQENLARLRERSIHVLEPDSGQLACNTEGPGRLPDPGDIIEIASMVLSVQDLKGLHFLVTAGATIEPLDPVRYITNHSSGKMGYAIAQEARRRGGAVTLISGPTHLKRPQGIELLGVRTAEEMKQTVFEYVERSDVVIKAAAVADFRPAKTEPLKIKKGSETVYTLKLTKNPDILEALGRRESKRRYLLIGFAAETNDLLENAQSKLKSKNLDMIVANDVTRPDAGFDSDSNLVKLIYSNGSVEDLPLMTKTDVAKCILDRVKRIREGFLERK
jgi:phosphopantothenoylcysteine decarboxylase/phosphopantothenate--cysteine ligase